MKNRNRPNRRTPEEDKARGKCRALVKSLGSRMVKVEKRHVAIASCKVWPDGLITAFHGWVDLFSRLEFCRDNPEFLIDGVYIYDADYETEAEDVEHVKTLVQEMPILAAG